MGDVRTERGDLVPEKWRERFAELHTWIYGPLPEDPEMPCELTLRDEVELITELASWQARAEQAESSRKHTQDWYARHYGKLQDWARKVLPEEWRTQFFSCIANGLYDPTKDVGTPYRVVAGFMVTPGGYFQMPTAQEQILFDQCVRAETAEERLGQAESTIAAWKKDAEDKAVLIAELTGPRWISVEEQLPEPGVNVLAIAHTEWRTSEAYTVYRTEPMTSNGELWTWRDSHLGSQEMWFTHWMPIPPPPGAVHETKDGVVSRSTDLEREGKNGVD